MKHLNILGCGPIKNKKSTMEEHCLNLNDDAGLVFLIIKKKFLL